MPTPDETLVDSDPFSLYFHVVADSVELKYRPGIAD